MTATSAETASGGASAIDLVLFDLGGVLIDWDPRRLYRKMFRSEAAMEVFLATVCTPAWNLELDRGRPFAEAVAALVEEHPAQREAIEAYERRWIEMIGGPIAPTVALLEAMKAEGAKLRALTNWSAETFPLIRDAAPYRFLDHFETIYVSGELRLIKPEPDIFHHVLRDTALEPARILFIDDSAANIGAADQLGFATHHFTRADRLGVDLLRRGLLA